MSKIKMRCTTCGKWFQSANAKEVTCPDCVQKARKAKLAAKNAPTQSQNKPTGPGITRQAPPPPKPKNAPGSTSHWFDTLDDVKVGQPDQPVRPKPQASPGPRAPHNESRPSGYSAPQAPPPGPGARLSERERGYGDQGRRTFRYDERGNYNERGYGQRGPAGYREREGSSGGYNRGPGGYREGGYQGGIPEGGGGYNRGPAGYRSGGGQGQAGTYGPRPRPAYDSPYGRGPRSERPGGRPMPHRPPRDRVKTPRPVAPPKPKREKTPPPAPFVPTQEQIEKVETRYLELAAPAEFDGIRTQIANEVGIPKKAVKKIIKDLRDRQHMPSWWEVQTYKGSAEELERIKEVYLPMLPIPPVGVHKVIATQLSLKPGVVYQAIKSIRLEMNLPQYNDPSLHGDFDAAPKKSQERPQTPTRPEQQAQMIEEGQATASVSTPVTTEANE